MTRIETITKWLDERAEIRGEHKVILDGILEAQKVARNWKDESGMIGGYEYRLKSESVLPLIDYFIKTSQTYEAIVRELVKALEKYEHTEIWDITHGESRSRHVRRPVAEEALARVAAMLGER